MKPDKRLETQEFYELMYTYRCASQVNKEAVIEAYENVKSWIRANYRK